MIKTIKNLSINETPLLTKMINIVIDKSFRIRSMDPSCINQATKRVRMNVIRVHENLTANIITDNGEQRAASFTVFKTKQ